VSGSDAVLDEHRIENPGRRLPLEPEVTGEPIQEPAFHRFHLPVGQYEVGCDGESGQSEPDGDHTRRGRDDGQGAVVFNRSPHGINQASDLFSPDFRRYRFIDQMM
jgi:hypothetical protein